jgi:hypothetical protein
VATVVAVFVVGQTVAAWGQGARNQSEGGAAFRGEVRFDVAMAVAGPVAAAIIAVAWRLRGRRPIAVLRAACVGGAIVSVATWPFLVAKSFPV